MRGTPEQRFWAKVDKRGPNECWNWLSATRGKNKWNPKGYGEFWFADGDIRDTHRYCYELLVGPIPEGLVLDHLCKNTLCCNPEHLEPVPQRTNLLRGIGFAAINAVVTHCPVGHEYTQGNTYRYKVKGEDGWRRRCRMCQANRARDKYRRDHGLAEAGCQEAHRYSYR